MPYEGLHIPDDTKSSLQWSRPAPEKKYLTPVGVLHAPGPVAPVPPIAPPPGKFRFGDVTIDAPDWINQEQAIQINDNSAIPEADLATFLDSIGMERSRSDRIAGQTIGTAAMGAVAGAGAAVPVAATSALVGGALGLVWCAGTGLRTRVRAGGRGRGSDARSGLRCGRDHGPRRCDRGGGRCGRRRGQCLQRARTGRRRLIERRTRVGT
ncbi:hypothetical protein ACQPZ2_25355 [Nocardia pseudovaccinii]|uniref:hypothetical protein n=1 Tax=Nocardia pseudovaccinii TaxID=189540 RepID=UPI003D92A04B